MLARRRGEVRAEDEVEVGESEYKSAGSQQQLETPSGAGLPGRDNVGEK
jgi:hypothetical protein